MTLLLRSCLFCLILVALANLTSCINDPEETPPSVKQLDIGSKTELGSLEVGPEGGTIEVSSGKLAGLKVVIPANAYPVKHTVRIYSSPITGNSFGENVNPRSDLITFDANGIFANENITITIPINVPKDEFAMGFYYDRQTKELEGLPISDATNTSITVVLRKPGEFFISSIASSKLVGVHTSGFVPGKDDWDFINEGTARTPNGQVAGMTLTALWYYHTQTAKGQPSLWGRFNSEYDVPPKMWYDNVEGLQFATETEIGLDWKKNWKRITANVNFGKNDLTRNAITYSILVTKRPQLVSLSSNEGDNLPLIVYKKDASDILLSDPNFQAKDDRKIHVSSTKPGSYSTAYSTIGYKQQDFAFLRTCAYLGVSALVNFEKISAISQIAANAVTAPLPEAFTFKSIGAEMMQVGDKVYTLADSISFTCADNTAQFYYDGTFVTLNTKQTIKLADGQNLIGILLTLPGKYSGTTLWRAWKWYTIYHQPNLLIIPVRDTGYIGEELRFTVKSLGPLGNIEWSAGSGDATILSATDTFVVSYLKTGEFEVSAAQIDNISGKPIVSATTSAKVLLYPFSISPQKVDVVAGYSILLFTQKRHTEKLHLRYEWDFGDGGKTTIEDSNIVSHKFLSSQLYNIRVKVYVATTNHLYGECSAQTSVSVIPPITAILDSLKKMNYISIVFTGLNTEFYSDRYYNGNLPPSYKNIVVSGGDGDITSTKRIIWTSNNFNADWSFSETIKDSVSGWPRTRSNDAGFSFSGQLSKDGSKLTTISGRVWKGNSQSTGGGSGGSSSSDSQKHLSFTNISAFSAAKDSIIFYFTGPELKNIASEISSSSNDESKLQGGHQYFSNTRYVLTDWYSTLYPPKVKVTFFK